MKTFGELQHRELQRTVHGEACSVLVLDNGALISAEAEAMLQALYSRSPAGIKQHLAVVAERGAQKFMSTYYVGYGHQSIGDCASTTAFIEGCSMLAAKAFQDWPLYSGQECSTRYIDFGTQPFMNPAQSSAGREVQERWRSFYVSSMPTVVAALRLRFARNEGESETVYHKAIAARAFDILRGFLPAGATTSLAWRMNLRQAADQLKMLRHYALSEVVTLATALEEALQQAHPSSFGHKRYPANEEYHQKLGQEGYFHNPRSNELAVVFDGIDRQYLKQFERAMRSRPRFSELPRAIAHAGIVRFEMQIDFGSYRDLQRHRALRQTMPLLTPDLGFEPWYLAELPASVANEARSLLSKQLEAITALNIDPATRQYYLPMGYRVAHEVSGDLSALAYMLELRAAAVVHPTLATRAERMARLLEERFANEGLVLHISGEAGRFDVKRGTQDIVKVA